MRTKKEWEKLFDDIKEEDFNLKLEDPLRRLRCGAPLSESDNIILSECFDALIKKVSVLKLLNTLNETRSNSENKPMAKNNLALTDKIIECLTDKHDHFIGKQTNEVTQAENRGFKQGLQWAIGTVESLEISAEFEEIARVMMKHLGKRTDLYCPHHTVIITNSTAELVQGQKSVGQIMDYVPD